MSLSFFKAILQHIELAWLGFTQDQRSVPYKYFIGNGGGQANICWLDQKSGNLCWAYRDRILNQVVIHQRTGFGDIASYNTGVSIDELINAHRDELIETPG